MATSKPTTKPDADQVEGDLYDVISNLDHDGKRYAAGSQVRLTEDQAALLPGVVKPAK